MTKKTDNDREVFTLTVKRRDYLQGIKDRLSREVGFYIECANERRRKDGNLQFEGIAMAAMLMPFIEDLSRRDDSGNNNTRKRERFLKNLGVGSPKIFWEMYRDLLLHNNGVHAVAVGNKGVQPLIVYTDEADEALFDGHPTTMNVGQVYRNLMKYLDAKIEEADGDATEEVPHAFRYNKNSDDPIIKALATEIERVHDSLMGNPTT